jgi:hypothetical protein
MFKETYFYIESGYIWGKGYSKNESNIFNAEIKRIFENVLTGWTLKEKAINNACDEYLYKDGLSSLYCHPMTISGIIDIELKNQVETALKNSKVIEFRYSKEFNQYENISMEEVENRIRNRKNEIVKDLFNIFQTNRRNQYYFIGNCDRLNSKYHINSINQKWDNHESKIIREVLKYAVEIGVIVTAKDDRDIEMYRALNKTEFKAWMRKNPVLLKEIGV